MSVGLSYHTLHLTTGVSVNFRLNCACSVCRCLALSHIPPRVPHAPKHTCNNFPICKGKQKQSWENGQPLPRRSCCAKCTEAARFCSHPECTSPAAPGFNKDKRPPFCSTRYADPAHASTRFWNLCNNTALGRRRLSTEMSRGSCHACRDRAYPCKYAPAGCQLHVRSKDSSSEKRQNSCLSDEIPTAACTILRRSVVALLRFVPNSLQLISVLFVSLVRLDEHHAQNSAGAVRYLVTVDIVPCAKVSPLPPLA